MIHETSSPTKKDIKQRFAELDKHLELEFLQSRIVQLHEDYSHAWEDVQSTIEQRRKHTGSLIDRLRSLAWTGSRLVLQRRIDPGVKEDRDLMNQQLEQRPKMVAKELKYAGLWNLFDAIADIDMPEFVAELDEITMNEYVTTLEDLIKYLKELDDALVTIIDGVQHTGDVINRMLAGSSSDVLDTPNKSLRTLGEKFKFHLLLITGWISAGTPLELQMYKKILSTVEYRLKNTKPESDIKKVQSKRISEIIDSLKDIFAAEATQKLVGEDSTDDLAAILERLQQQEAHSQRGYPGDTYSQSVDQRSTNLKN